MITAYEHKFINERISEHAIAEFISNNKCEIIIDINIDLCKPQLTEKQTAELYKRASVCELSKKLNKSILELCFEIKPITVERLNAISVEQWTRLAEKHNIKHNTCVAKCGEVSEDYDIKELWLDVDWSLPIRFNKDKNDIGLEKQDQFYWHDILKDLIFYINKNFDRLDILELAKAIHDLVWELENI